MKVQYDVSSYESCMQICLSLPQKIDWDNIFNDGCIGKKPCIPGTPFVMSV